MGSTRLEDLVPDARAKAEELIRKAGEQGIKLAVVSTRRTCADQRSIYAQGRTAPGAIISGADGCRSWHVWGRAVDVMVVDDNGKWITNGWDKRYDQVGEIGESLGMIWGGKFSWGRDAGHFEYHPGVQRVSEVCPNPADCEAAVAKAWPVDVPETSDEEPSDEQDVVYTWSPEQAPRSLALPVIAVAAVAGAAWLWWKSIGKRRPS